MLEHEQKKCMENDRNANSPGADQKKLESVGSVLWDMCSILSFQN